jgi:flagellar biosynthetic protein FliP
MNEFIDLFNSSGAGNISTSVRLLLLLTVFSVAPGILILMTCFTRIVIVLSFVRTSLATNSMPPNQVLVGLLNDDITLNQAYEKAEVPIKEFMSKHTRQKDLALFLSYAKIDTPESIKDIPLTAMVPAFAISELKTAFQIGFMIFIPFLIIDMVVASVLMSMGMMMLPPVMISLPFKILLFVLVDGWYLIVKSLLQSF